MTGPEHYREAEKCLARANTCDVEQEPYWLRRGQVHATLALASATAHTPYREYATDAFGGSS